MERPVFSEMLSDRRRELGFSIRQASRVLRLREEVLIAFEEGDFEQMPKSGYAQGMISSYARYLGLDPAEVIAAYADDYERYKREARRNRRLGDMRYGGTSGAVNQYGERVGQPYVRSRGLLPTSGGLAGDMGSFSTTRVRPRSFDSSNAEGASDAVDGSSYAPARPYTAKTPRITQRTGDAGYGQARDEIRTMRLDEFEYDDDLRRFGNNAQSFETASSDVGRRSSRHISDSSRPRVSRRDDGGTTRSRGSSRDAGRGRSSRRGGGRGRNQGVLGNLLQNNTAIVVGVFIALVILLSVILVTSVSSCVRQGSEARTVPVSAALDTKSAADGSQTQGNAADTSTNAATDGTDGASAQHDADTSSQGKDATGADDGTTSPTTTSNDKETSVSVSVLDGAVTWLEVECDGVSDVAQTVTGPWQKTYTVEDAITIQAGDTTSVSVVQNGRQVQFDSMASGIGTLRIQGTKKPKKNPNDADGTSASTGSSAKTGNNAATSSEDAVEDSTDEDGSDYTDDGYSYDGSDYGYDDSGYENDDYGEYGDGSGY